MNDKNSFRPKSFAVIGAGPVGCIVAAFLAKGGYDVTLCDIVPELIEPALDPGIVIEGAENISHSVSRICHTVDDLADNVPDVIFLTVKANATPLIASAIESFHNDNLYVISWQNGIDTELALAKVLGRKSVFACCSKLWLRPSGSLSCPECRFTTPPTIYRNSILNLNMLPFPLQMLSAAAVLPQTVLIILFPWSGAKVF